MRKKTNYRWLIKIVLVSVAASLVFTFASTEILGLAGYAVSFAMLAAFIAIGIAFDVIGIAATAATEAPFHSMAAHHTQGAAESLRLVRGADRVSSFCNDVVGDVTGIVSGTTAALIAARLMEGLSTENILFPLLISGAVTGLMVGGKAAGKTFAINNSTAIVFRIGRIIRFLRPKRARKR